MQRLRSVIKWLAIGLGLTVALALIALAVYMRSEDFSYRLREQAVRAINASIRGTVAVERVEGSLWGDLTLYGVSLRHEADEIAAFPRLHIRFSLWPLIHGRVQVARIDALEPRAVLRRNAAGEWNVAEALAPRQAEAETASAWVVLIDSLTVRKGFLTLHAGDADVDPYHLKDFYLYSGLHLRAGSVDFDVREVGAVLVGQRLPDLRMKGALAYRQSGTAPAVLDVSDFWVVSRDSQVKLAGRLIQSEPLRVDAVATLKNLAPADVRYFLPGWPIKQHVAGKLETAGPLDGLRGEFQLASVGAKLAGSFRADLTVDQPRYTTMLELSGFDVRRWLDSPNFAGVARGTIEASGSGFALPAISAKARGEIRGAAAHGWALGDVSLDGLLENRVASIDGQLESALGGASWSGKIVLQDKPLYEVALAVKNLDIERALPTRDVLRGRLNLEGVVEGAGLSLADMHARADLKILPSMLGPVEVTQGRVDAVLSDRRLRIARAALSTVDSTLTVAGELGLEAAVSGALDYQLRIDDLSRWLSLLGRKGSGAVNLGGRVRGNLSDLVTEGSARVSGLRLDGVTITDGNAEFALRGSQEQFFPRGAVTARLSGVDAGMSFRRIDVKANLQQPAPSVALQVNAEDHWARRHAVSGAVEFLDDAVVAQLRTAELGSPSGRWTLARPATLTQRGDSFLIDELSFTSDGRELSAAGRFALSGAQDLTLRIDRVPLETLAAFLPKEPEMTGILAAEARITGTAAAPEVSALARLSNTAIAGQRYAGARAELQYRDELANLRITMQQDATHSLTGAGKLPMVLNWHDGWNAQFGDDLEFRVRSTGISLAFLNAFSGEGLENIRGEIALELLARGSIERPDLQGSFRLRDGGLKIVPLDIEIAAIAAAGSLDSQRLIVRELYAKAKDGEITGSGALALEGFDVSTVKLSLSAKRWPAIETERYRLRVAGDIELGGSVEAPKVAGKLTVIEGSLRPDLAFLRRSDLPLERDETIVVVRNKQVVEPLARQAPKQPGFAESDWFKNLSLNLKVSAPDNLWIRHPDLVAELTGNVEARKAPQRDLDLIGRIDVIRGWVAFQGRRLQFARGAIEFTGGETIAPALDVVAQYRVQNYQVQVLIGGTSENPTLTLSSQPPLEQAEILALLIFGKPLDSLNKNEQGSLQQSALNITSGFVAARVAESVSQALGLDALGLDISDVTVSGGRIGLGRYIAPGAYVSVSQQLAGERGQEVVLEYQITRDWKISSSTASTGSNGIDIIWHKRY